MHSISTGELEAHRWNSNELRLFICHYKSMSVQCFSKLIREQTSKRQQAANPDHCTGLNSSFNYTLTQLIMKR